MYIVLYNIEIMVNKGLKSCKEFTIDPFLNNESEIDVPNLVMSLSKSALDLMHYILNKKAFLDSRFVFDICDFKKFANKKTDSSAIKALGELCCIGVLAKTTIFRVYWVNKKIFLQEKEMDFLVKSLNTRNK